MIFFYFKVKLVNHGINFFTFYYITYKTHILFVYVKLNKYFRIQFEKIDVNYKYNVSYQRKII